MREHRARALTPEHPFIRGTAQNPDVYFQARETVNPYYARLGGIVQEAMDALAERTGRAYRLVEYAGHPEATRVLVIMGSGGVAARETVTHLGAAGERVGVLQVRLYRPFPAAELVGALPPTVEAVAVLDRTKEPGSQGEPLFLDVLTSLSEAHSRGDLTTMPRCHRRALRPLVEGVHTGHGGRDLRGAGHRVTLDRGSPSASPTTWGARA